MTDLVTLYDLFLSSSGITTDSRNIEPKKLFWALRGDNFDGNQFALAAVADGAIAAIVDNPEITGENVYLVDDCLVVLQHLATHHRKQYNIPIIAITGSNGKTTTKELVNSVLGQKYFTLATIGNLNNHIGVPLTLLRLNANHKIAVIEMGANHKHEIAELCAIALPSHGIITNIGKAHIGEFGGIDNVAYAKTRLYKFLADNNGTIFINGEDESLNKNIEAVEVPSLPSKVYFGTNDNNDYCYELISESPFITLGYNKTIVNSNLIGHYNLYNLMAAFTIGKHFGVDNIDCKNALETYLPTNNRSQLIESGSNILILDAYNANPTSMTAALSTLSKMDFSRKIAILGDMFELGIYTDKEHLSIIHEAQRLNIDTIVLVGNYFGRVPHSGCIHFELAQGAKDWYHSQEFNGTAILIKGSRSMKLEQILS